VGLTLAAKKPAAVAAKVEGDRPTAERLYGDARKAHSAGRIEEAVRGFRESIKADPTYTAPRMRLAQTLDRQGKPKDAAAELEAAIGIDRHLYEAYLELGAIYERLGQNEKALAIYRRSIEANRNQPPVIQAIEALKRRMK